MGRFSSGGAREIDFSSQIHPKIASDPRFTQVKELLDELKKDYNTTTKEISSLAEKEINLPISIYSSKELSLDIIGLMCIPPNNLDSNDYFKEMEHLNSKFKLKNLSMGMSNDYLNAIHNGANFVRIGSKIFGSRI